MNKPIEIPAPDASQQAAALARDLARELGLEAAQVARVIALFDSDNTIPFIARYRKEVTGNLDEGQLRLLADGLARRRRLAERRAEILRALAEAGQLTSELASRLAAADKLTTLEDLYLPFRPKRRTRASMARERGLAPLADLMGAAKAAEPPLAAAAAFVDPTQDVPTPEDALAGARDILAERLSEDADIRGRARALAMRDGLFTATKAPKGEDAQGKYAQYHAFSEPVARVQPHRVLACDRGEAEGVLKVAIALPEAAIQDAMRQALPRAGDSRWREEREQALSDAYKRLLAPAIERDVRAALTEKAQTHAIGVFAANVKALLLQPPLRGQTVLAIDPGFRTGCKVVVVDPTGRPLFDGIVIYPHEPQKRWSDAVTTLRGLIRKHGVSVVAIGNGTASRETEALVAETIRDLPGLGYVMVSESGASVYSASETARAEFPDLDATQRGTISIARRLQDPLAELVKIEPQAIGVGLYQHDLDQKALSAALDGVVEDAVNHVGVEINTASAALLTRVSGLKPKVAQAIVERRAAGGPFQTRADLKAVKGLGEKTFEQAAGFLRIAGGPEPLDNTAIHPESYRAARTLLQRLGIDPASPDAPRLIAERRTTLDLDALARELGLGLPTLQDILANLAKPGRDPREELPKPHLRQDVLRMEDLAPGMRLTGTVRNVVDFGAFVDIGVKQDGLIHVSELADRFVRNPLEAVSIGDVFEVEVIEVDAKRGRISLSRRRVLRPQ